MKHINKISEKLLKTFKPFLEEKNIILLTGAIIQMLLFLIIYYSNEPIIVNFIILSSIFYLIALKLVKTHSYETFLLILVFAFTFRFTIGISSFLIDSTNIITASKSGVSHYDYQVFRDISQFIGGETEKLLALKLIVFIFELLLIKVLFNIYKSRKHYFIHYLWNIPIIYEFYFRPNLIVIFLFFFFFSLQLAINRKKFSSSVLLSVSFFFNFGIFPFFAFFFKKLKFWLLLTVILCAGFIFLAGYYKLLFSYMTTFQEIERGLFSFLSFLKIILPYEQIVILLYYSLIISIVIYMIIKEVYIFDSIYAFLLTLILINPNKEFGFISFLLAFTIIFPNMGVIYFSLILFTKMFLFKPYFTETQNEIVSIIAVLVLYGYHIKIFFDLLIHFYKDSSMFNKKI